MKLLVIDCCIRGEISGTKRLYEAYLKTLGPETEIEVLNLMEQNLRPMLMEDIVKRDELLAQGQLDHEMFRYVHPFVAADRILIAAPYWDWSFPSLLKVYLEHVSVARVTFRYEGAQCIGQCRADKILYFATCGSFLGDEHQGVEYIKEIGAMFGIHEVEAHVVEGLDVEPGMRETVLEQGIQSMLMCVNSKSELSDRASKKQHTEKSNTGKPYTEDLHTEDLHTEDLRTEELYTEELHTEDLHTEEPHTEDPHTEKLHTKDLHTEDLHTEKSNTGKPHTEKLYYEDSHMQSFEAVVTACETWKDGWRIALDRTAFFPEGGGQFGDTGVLEVQADQADQIRMEVTDTREKDGIIYHLTKEPLPVGIHVCGHLDFEKRFDRMQQHTGEHIISGIVHGLYGCDNVGFHLGDDLTTLDFNLDLTAEQVEEVEQKANQAVFANLPVQVQYPDRDTLKTMEYRSKIEIEGQVRIVTIPGIDQCACCAPHTRTTGEVGLIKILSCDRHRGGCRMVMASGMRALKDYAQKQRSVSEVSVLLSAKPECISEAVAHTKEQQAKLRGQLNQIQAVYLNDKLAAVQPEDRLVCIFEEEMDNVAVRNFVNEAMERCSGICAAFVGTRENGYRYILGSRSENMRELAKVLNETFAGKGGGKPEMVQGSLTGCQEEIQGLLENYCRSR